MKSLFRFLFLFPCLVLFSSTQEGKGYLEEQQGQKVLHLKGSPYEIGLQHGKLLKEEIKQNIATFVDRSYSEFQSQVTHFQQSIPQLVSHIPADYCEEMRGIADGAEVPFSKILSINLFPEMFHCSGITATKEATKDGLLYQARVLDYGIGKNLQETAVLMVVQPEGKHAFLNVSYAGFVGSITGMNEQKISIGEIGGRGYGRWDGMPMSFLLRKILEEASSLQDAKDLLAKTPRTCEYFYVISDGNTNDSFGSYATESQLQFIEPGTSYALFALQPLPLHYGLDGQNDKFFLPSAEVKQTSHQIVFYDQKRLVGAYYQQPKDCVLLIGLPYPERYPVLAERMLSFNGKIDEKALQEIIKAPVARPTNLHNAIFCPSQLKIWIAHAGPQGEPAYGQPYAFFSLSALLN